MCLSRFQTFGNRSKLYETEGPASRPAEMEETPMKSILFALSATLKPPK
jgi:hypothetical protein